MRIAIFGTGGAGGRFGAFLARSGKDITFIARGEHLNAIRADGLHLETPEGEIHVYPAQVTDDPAEAGVMDTVILGVKTWQVKEAATAMQPMIGPETIVVPLQNGVEASAELAEVLGEEHALGGLCGTISWIVAPGRIRSIGGLHFIRFGELNNQESDRTKRLLEVLNQAEIQAEIPPDIQTAIWEKFLFVVSFGGVGAVARAPIGVMRTLPETRTMLERCMREIFEVSRAREVGLDADYHERALVILDGLAPASTTSLHRDIAAGKPSELEAWNGAVVRIGRQVGVPTPLHEFIYHSLLPLEKQARGQLTFPT